MLFNNRWPWPQLYEHMCVSDGPIWMVRNLSSFTCDGYRYGRRHILVSERMMECPMPSHSSCLSFDRRRITRMTWIFSFSFKLCVPPRTHTCTLNLLVIRRIVRFADCANLINVKSGIDQINFCFVNCRPLTSPALTLLKLTAVTQAHDPTSDIFKSPTEKRCHCLTFLCSTSPLPHCLRLVKRPICASGRSKSQKRKNQFHF